MPQSAHCAMKRGVYATPYYVFSRDAVCAASFPDSDGKPQQCVLIPVLHEHYDEAAAKEAAWAALRVLERHARSRVPLSIVS